MSEAAFFPAAATQGRLVMQLYKANDHLLPSPRLFFFHFDYYNHLFITK